MKLPAVILEEMRRIVNHQYRERMENKSSDCEKDHVLADALLCQYVRGPGCFPELADLYDQIQKY